MNKELFEVIEYHIENKMLLTVERGNIFESDKCRGFPIKVTDDFLLMTNIIDFHDEGYILLRCEDITDVYSKDSDLFYESVCFNEGLYSKTKECPVHVITDFTLILSQLNTYNKYISIHCENESEHCGYFLGKIDKMLDDGIKFRSIGVDGQWNEVIDYIPFCDITMITVEDYYAKMFYKYTN